MPREEERARARTRILGVGICIIVVSLLLLLLLSWGLEMRRMYQVAKAKKIATLAKGYPDECSAETRGLWTSVKSYLRWYSSWSGDPCEQYHEALEVDPLSEVNPLTALTAVLTRAGVSQPLEEISASIGRSLRLLFQEIPAQWQPFIMGLLIVLAILKLVMACEYSFQSFVFSFGPSPNVAGGTHPTTTAVEHQAVGEKLGENEQSMIDGRYNYKSKMMNKDCPPKKLAIEPPAYLQNKSFRDSGYSGVSVSERASLFESSNTGK